MSKRTVNYICFGCGGLYGGERGADNCTAHEGSCDNCGDVALLCSVDDWDWPEGKPKRWRGTGRD
jgi:hypothetical protein